ncbi:hypothetical protein OROGR_013548 [Orobanche gracilis]
MAEAAVISSGHVGITEPESDAAFFHRKIDFHMARKPFSGFRNNINNGFKLVTLNPNPEPNKASGSSKKCERSSEIYETGLDPELSFEITFRRILVLAYTILETPVFLIRYCNVISGISAKWEASKFMSLGISRNFRNARQEDAHEYMVNLLESMHKCCLPSGVHSESPSAYEKSLVHKIFGGHLRSQVKCMQCSYCSNKFDPFLDLSLEIVRADSLLKALAHFTAKEQLDEGTKQYQCQQCRQKVKALKQLTIHKAPHVLTVHLKRFSSDTPGRKIDKKISFGPTLDLKPFVTGYYDGGLNYTLYGVLVHAGWSTHSGHYYCFVRTSSGMWYSLDDNQVFQVNERRVLEQKAYMLFYVRDRKNFITKKPVGFIPKENMVMNPFGNTAYSKLNQQLKEKIQSGTVESQVGGSTEQTDDLKIEGSHENVQRLEAIQPGLLSQHSSLGDMKKKSTKLKLKRKLLKYQVPTMSLSSNIMFGVGLCMRKKKLKRRKDQKKSPKAKHVTDGNNLSSDIGGSISDDLLPSLNGSHSQRKKSKCNLDGKNQNSRERNISGEGSDNEIREIITVGGTTLSAEKQPQKSQPASQGPIPVDNQMERRQIDVMSMLTRGLEEKTVARWDGIDASRMENFETKIAGTSQIGYIGDEWDEEYDRGKRKKVRGSKISFDGPNLFQEIATENSKRKRAKLNRVENQPFRI